MLFALHTIVPLLISLIATYLLLRYSRNTRALLVLGISFFLVFRLLTEPAIMQWYFANLPIAVAYLSRVVLYTCIAYTLLALPLVGIKIGKHFSQLPLSSQK